ncbi:light harvesting protein [Emiliania huxleyi CCMP1516]|jgi:hypothetical protein|uniref:Light harvesting protein n=2 Tax=Emiliania huxleyi TaxID=2903 RepID=A0A0D3KWU3_EMIH1|nr:light harvesting protein [Emiliania huxleyi CCMP1516]EOD40228.1 light harvesting protein [Emiliania huxleyi CCMP1516]|eukprot:XP_005792657.1 light harvesting protein [Emiliania huxleyi CCMP1516]
MLLCTARSLPVASPRATVRLGVQDMEGTGPETGGQVFDPIGLSKIASSETLAWYRAAELKHGRIAMAAVTGWAWVSSGGPLFPGYISVEQGITFESLGRDGYAAWDATPENGKAQILGIVGLLEILGESAIKPHYMAGGTPGKIPLLWDPLGFTAKLSSEVLAEKRVSELKNGRLAMIGVMSLVSAHFIPNSVPLLP